MYHPAAPTQRLRPADVYLCYTIIFNIMYNYVATLDGSDQKKNTNKKKNGFNYNSGVNMNFNTDCSCLISAPSHKDLLQVTKGAYLTNPISAYDNSSGCLYNIKDGNFLVTTYGEKVVSTHFDGNTSNEIHPGPFCDVCPDACANYPGVVVDPSYSIFYNVSGGCEQTVPFMKNVDVSYLVHVSGGDISSQTFAQYASYNKLHTFDYPRKLTFVCPKKNN